MGDIYEGRKGGWEREGRRQIEGRKKEGYLQRESGKIAECGRERDIQNYNQLASVLSGIPCTDKLLLIGDFNVRMGRENDKWPLVMGKHGIGKGNSNGELLLALCSEFKMIVTNTMFK